MNSKFNIIEEILSKKFIDDQVLKKLSNDTPLKETLILLPPNDLDIKIDLVSMYTI